MSTSHVHPLRRMWIQRSFWVRLAISVGLIVYLGQRLDWRQVRAALAALDVLPCALAVGLYFLSQVASARRWARLSRPLGFAGSDGYFLKLYLEGCFFSLCLPTSVGGDVVKAYRLAPDLAGRLLAGCAVLADRLCGLAALGIVGLVASLHLVARFALWQTALVAVALLVALWVALRLGPWLLEWLTRRTRDSAVHQRGLARLAVYHDRPELLRRAVIWGFVVQSLNALALLYLGRGLGLDVPVAAYFFVAPMVALAAALPVSINGMGVREASLAALLASYGVSEELGVTLGLLWFLTGAVPSLAGGVVFWLARRHPHPAAATHPSSTRYQPSTRHQPSTLHQISTPHQICSPQQPSATNRPASSEPPATLVRCCAPQQPAAVAPWAPAPCAGISVIVTLSNQVAVVDSIYQRLTRVLSQLGRPYEIVAVDNGSSDGTTQRLDYLAARDPALKVVELCRPIGAGAMLAAGFDHARHEAIVRFDGDQYYQPADISRLMAELDAGYDLVHARRSPPRSWTARTRAWWRDACASRAAGHRLRDLDSTLLAVRRHAAAAIVCDDPLDRVLPALAAWRGARCTQIEIGRAAGENAAHAASRPSTRALVVRLAWERLLRGPRATARLGLRIGMVATAGGLVCGLTAAVVAAVPAERLLLGGFQRPWLPLALLAGTALVAGGQMIGWAMLVEMLSRAVDAAEGRRPYVARRTVNLEPASAPPSGTARKSRRRTRAA